jgi:hypothetical protein
MFQKAMFNTDTITIRPVGNQLAEPDQLDR